MPETVSDDVRDFFANFERAGAELDLDATGAQFADYFLSADPNGTHVVPKAALLAALPQRQQMFRSAGLSAMRLRHLAQTTLDDNYVLAKTEWAMEADQPGAPAVDATLSSTFILRREAGTLRIVFYLNHRDVMALISERVARFAAEK
jgi:ketosteroid isomerase-like protein